MVDSTTIRVYESDKEKIAELTDADRPWPARVAQVIAMAEQE